MENVEKPRLLLHSCCGPCSSAVVERLAQDWAITVFYYNPNISRQSEYEHRRDEQKRFLACYGKDRGLSIDFLEGPYEPAVFFQVAAGLEEEKEGGLRCEACFRLRLAKTASLAAERGFDAFDTTLSVSPYKNYEAISRIGRALEAETKVRYLGGNYKKKDGYRRSVELSKAYGLYRQHYCGCVFSERNE